MFEREFHQHVADAMHEIVKEIEKDLPEEVVKDLHEMASIQAGITKRLHTNRAIELEKIQRYNELCYKHFGKMQDGEEFTKEEPKPETKTPVTQRRFDFGEAIHMLKDGCKLARDGWNGKNQYIVLAKNIRFDTFDVKNWTLLHTAIGSKAIAFVGTSGTQMGWLASQADMLAEDWHCVEVEG